MNKSLGVLGGLLVLVTVPLSMVVVVATAGERGPAETFMEAGASAYLLLLTVGLASLAAPFLLTFSIPRPALQPLALVAFLPALALSALSLRQASASTTEAVLHASPADQLTIIAGSCGEGLNLALLATLMCGVGFALVALGSLVTAVAPPRASRLVTAVVAGGLAVASGFFCVHAKQVTNIFSAVAHASPADRGVILGASLGEIEPLFVMGAWVLLAVVVAAVAGGVFVLRQSRPAGLSVLLSALLSALALLSFETTVRATSFAIPEGMNPLYGELVEVTGSYSSALQGVWFERDEAPERIDELIDEAARSSPNEEDLRVVVMAQQGLPAAVLRRAMQRAASQGARLELVGNRHGRKLEAPPPAWARKFVEYLSESTSGARIELRRESACPACAGRATLGPKGLEVTLVDQAPASWAFDEESLLTEPTQQLDFGWTGNVEDLARASSIAFSHGALLSVSVAPPAR